MGEKQDKKVKVLYFASAREFLGNIDYEEYIIQEGQPLNELVKQIKEKHHDQDNFIAILDRSMIAVNDEYVYELGKTILKGSEEIAVIPPISGG